MESGKWGNESRAESQVERRASSVERRASRAKPLGSGAADYDRVVALEGRHGFTGEKCRQPSCSGGAAKREGEGGKG